MDGTWDDLNRRLAGAILGLDLDDSLVIGERAAAPRRGIFGGRPRPSTAPRRFVQVTAARSVLIGECVGSTSFGGTWEMTAETEARLLKQGWERPWSSDQHTFQREAPLVGAPRLAFAAVLALQTLGCDLADIEVELVRESSD